MRPNLNDFVSFPENENVIIVVAANSLGRVTIRTMKNRWGSTGLETCETTEAAIAKIERMLQPPNFERGTAE